MSLGVDAGSSGVFTISNTDLDFSGRLLVGDGGNGTLNVQDGATVTVDTLDIAEQSTSGSQDNPSVVTVSGAGSTLTVNDELIVGVDGYGTLEITDGGTLSYAGDQLIVGDQSDGVGEIDITGNGQSLTLDTNLIVGNAGIGTVNVDPIHLFLQALHLGEQAGAQGIFNVTGQGSIVTVAQEVIVGNAGAGEVHVRAGAAFESNGELTVGSQDGSTGTIEVSGDNSTWTTSGDDTTFGDAGGGTLDVNAGGTFDASASSVTFASQIGSTGSLTITGDDSSMTAAALTFGDSGRAKGTIEDAGALSVSGDLALGDGDGGSGNLTVAGGDLTVGGNLTIGGAGTGILVSQGGAITVQGYAINIGDQASGTGTFTINTADASLDFGGTITVGAAGNGAMFVQLGANITVDAVTVADQTGSTGSLTVDSASLQTGDLTIGSSGQGTLDVKNGASLISTGEGKIADLVAGVISGATVETGGIWALNGDLTVGGSGIGTLSVDDATVSTLSSVTIGDLAVSSGFVTVTGSVSGPESGTSSSLGWGGVLTVGNDGFGTLDIEAGALVGPTPGGAGEVDIAAHDGSTGSITVDGTDSLLNATDIFVGGTLLTPGGDGTLTAQHGGSVAVTDTVTLWNGNVDVADDGLLVIGTVPSASDPAADSAVLVRSDGLLTGDGTITGDVIDNGAIDAEHGTLKIDGAVSGSGVIDIGPQATAEIDGPVAADTRVDFLTDNGTLLLDQPSDFSGTIDGLQLGDTIDLAGVDFSNGASAQLLDHNVLQIVVGGALHLPAPMISSLIPTKAFRRNHSSFHPTTMAASTSISTPACR